MQLMKELIRGEKIHIYIYTILEIFCDCEPPSKYYMPKLLTLDKEDDVMVYECLYPHRSHIVIDPSTCDACPLSLLAKNSAVSKDTTCASKNPLTHILSSSVHHTYLGIEQDPSSKLSLMQKGNKIASKCVRSFSVREN